EYDNFFKVLLSFFFSSRRRHTRFSRDWSSDVCSSDLDDFYGTDSFQKMAQFLTTDVTDDTMALMGFQVGNTMSDYGYVSRGICEVDQDGHLVSVTERTNIYYVSDGQESKKIVYEEGGQQYDLDPATRVSMNFWGF